MGNNDDYGHSVAIQSDGKIIVAGYSKNSSNSDFSLVRYNTDGILDTSFGPDSNGKVITDVGGNDDEDYSVAIQSDGKIVAVGQSKTDGKDDFALVRYNTDGILDTSFSSEGKVITGVSSIYDIAYDVAIQNDGKIIAAGQSYFGTSIDFDFTLVRYNTNGTLDTTFSGDGKVHTDIGSSNDRAHSVVIQRGGKIIVAGQSSNGKNFDFTLVSYNSNGTLDTTFSDDGKVITDVSSFSNGAWSVAIQNDGKIVVAGYSENGSNSDFALARYQRTSASLAPIYYLLQ